MALLHKHLASNIPSRLPYANNGAIWLNLINIRPWNPNLLGRVCRGGHNRSCHNSWRSHDNRCGRCDCVSNHTSNNPTNESGPEIPTTVPPEGAVVMMITMMHHRWRTMSKSTVESTMMSAVGSRKRRCKDAHCDSNCNY